ncbi:hypothetical protein BsWGS_07049 [Bradybaena similaris]
MFVYAIFILLPVLTFADDPNAELAAKLFNALDTSGDKNISKAEFDAFFRNFDLDVNGTISRQEFKCTAKRLDAAFNGIENLLYQLLDTNWDGQVDKQDLDKVFEFLDKNQNCDIEPNEFLYFFKAVAAMVVRNCP